MKYILVCGAGGFIGSNIVKHIKQTEENTFIVGVDLKMPEFDSTYTDYFFKLDLRDFKNIDHIFKRASRYDEIYQFAADMGGAGFVFTGKNDADILHNSAIINLNILDALSKRINFADRIFYSSSACIYPDYNQTDPSNPKCSENSAYPASPDSEYGWEKLFSEHLYLNYAKNKNINVKIARYHNIFGPFGTWKGGREKAPAALSRKIAEAKNEKYDEISIWGYGEQTRSFLYINDCIDATLKLMRSNKVGPYNIGSEEMVTINQLTEMIMEIAKIKLKVKHVEGPIGVMGRNSDNKLILSDLNWSPKYSLKEGLEFTYNWIEKQVFNQ